MIVNFCEGLLSMIRDRKAVYVKSISSGGFEKLEDYKFCVGILKGLEESEDIVREMYRNMFESHKLNEGENDVENRIRLY